MAVGDRVEMDAGLVEVETDKALMEIPSPVAGTVLSHGAPAGSVLAVGEILAIIGEPGELDEPQDLDNGVAAPSIGPVVPRDETVESPPIVGSISSEAVDLSAVRREPVGNGTAQASSSTGSAQTLPMIRRMAADLGIDLGAVEGTGPGGRITRDDVQRAAGAHPSSPVGAADDAVESRGWR